MTVDPRALSAARVLLHHAAQLPAAPAATHLPAEDDHSHANLGWVPWLRGFAGRSVDDKDLVLLVDPFELVVRERGVEVERHGLVGRTIASLLADLAPLFDPGAPLVLPGYALPPHAVGQGEAFPAPDPAQLSALGDWYALADRLLEEARRGHGNATPVRTWPHHFDHAFLFRHDRELESERARSIGVGLSPGDGSYDEPYFYVTAWPRPEAPALPRLPWRGRWHTEGWFGAVLTGTDTLAAGEGSAELAPVRSFVDAAVSACRTMLGV